jgi:hypothetical protein
MEGLASRGRGCGLGATKLIERSAGPRSESPIRSSRSPLLTRHLPARSSCRYEPARRVALSPQAPLKPGCAAGRSDSGRPHTGCSWPSRTTKARSPRRLERFANEADAVDGAEVRRRRRAPGGCIADAWPPQWPGRFSRRLPRRGHRTASLRQPHRCGLCARSSARAIHVPVRTAGSGMPRVPTVNGSAL